MDENRKRWRKAKDWLEHVEAKIHAASRHLHSELYKAQEAEMRAAEHLPLHLGLCVTCSVDIFDGDNHSRSLEGEAFCEEHSPKLSDVIANWEQCLDADPCAWFDLNFDSEDEMKAHLASMRSDLAKNGDRSTATP